MQLASSFGGIQSEWYKQLKLNKHDSEFLLNHVLNLVLPPPVTPPSSGVWSGDVGEDCLST